MTRFILTILLALAICSCRSHKEVQSEVVNVAHVEQQSVSDRDSVAKILTMLQSQTDIDISGVTVDYFPADSLHPDIRATPSRIRIDKINVKQHSDVAQSSETATSAKETEDLLSDSKSEDRQDTKADRYALSPPSWFLFFSIIITTICISAYLYHRFFRKS